MRKPRKTTGSIKRPAAAKRATKKAMSRRK